MWLVVVAALVAGCRDNPDFDPPIKVTNLRASWSTPNQIRWDWDSVGRPEELGVLELVTGPSAEAVETRSADSHLWTPADNPELGAQLRYIFDDGSTEVGFSVTDQFEPNTVVYAQLTSVDSRGRRSVTNVAQGQTRPPPTEAIVVFADDDPDSDALPEDFVVSQDAPFAGTAHYQFRQQCVDESCWVNLRRNGLYTDLTSLPEAAYADGAYFELALAVTADADPTGCLMWLFYDETDERSRYEGWATRADGNYKVFQVPLTAFVLRGEAVSHDIITTTGLFGFNVGCQWRGDAVVRVDEIRIRW
jgi:hypothetical protein